MCSFSAGSEQQSEAAQEVPSRKETQNGEPSIITDEMRRMIGAETPPYLVQVEKGDVRRFLKAIGDTNPLFSDEEFAQQTKYRGAIVPPTFFCPDPLVVGRFAGLKSLAAPFKYDIDGGTEWEFFQPVRVGDTLQMTAKITDIYEKQGSTRTGRMLFIIVQVTCHNQRGELVGVSRGSDIRYEGPRV